MPKSPTHKRKKVVPIYMLDPKMKWSTFKLLQDKLVKQSGPVPEHGDKILWEMLRAKQIYCWFDEKLPNDMAIGLKLPKGRPIKFISSPHPKRV